MSSVNVTVGTVFTTKETDVSLLLDGYDGFRADDVSVQLGIEAQRRRPFDLEVLPLSLRSVRVQDYEHRLFGGLKHGGINTFVGHIRTPKYEARRVVLRV